MKILLIKPPLTSSLNMHMPVSEPLGLMYLAGFLRAYKKDVYILDASIGEEFLDNDGVYRHGLSDAKLKEYVEKISPDIVGINCMFTIHSKGSHDVARVVKEISRDIPVIFGGAHTSALPELVLKDCNVDIVVKGEGELTLLELANSMERKKPLIDVDGTVVRANGTIKYNKPRPFIKDLDLIPFPARDMLDMWPYWTEKYQIEHSLSPPRATIVTSRGCPYNCNYCSIHSLWAHKYRTRSPQNVIEEIEYLKKAYGIREIAFMDDNISFDKKRMEDLVDILISKNVNIRWSTPNGIAIWTLDEQIIEKAKRSGCYKLTFGIETGSSKTQKFIRKSYIDLERTKQLIKYCNSIGLWTLASFVLGFPYETKRDIEQTIEYSIDCDIDMASYFIATPYPGTELYEIYKKEGLLSDSESDNILTWTASVSNITCDTKVFSKVEVQSFKRLAEKEFYKRRFISFLNPLRVTRKIHSWEEFKYFLKMLRIRAGLFWNILMT